MKTYRALLPLWLTASLGVGGAGCAATEPASSSSVERGLELDPADEESALCIARRLSRVGRAMDALPEIHSQSSNCIGLPEQWLFTLDGTNDTFADVQAAVQAEFLKTKKSFAHAALGFQKEWDFANLIVQLHKDLGAGGDLPDDKKPVLRFMYGLLAKPPTGVEVLLEYLELVQPLMAVAGADPARWNVKIALKEAFFGYLDGWNHMKLNIRDGYSAVASSIHTKQLELAIHLAGRPAALAESWYDRVWTSPPGTVLGELCAASDPVLCETVPSLTLPAPDEPGYAIRAANVFALRRGYVFDPFRGDWVVNDEADRALFAGMAASQHSIFFLSPGMTADKDTPFPWQGYSEPLVDRIADRIAAGVDVKLVWGDTVQQPRDLETWHAIERQILTRLRDTWHLPPHQVSTGLCMFHVADFGQLMNRDPGSHAKFYMLDGGGFYVGSQNMYPSGITSGWGGPELEEFGYYVDADPVAGTNMDLSALATDRVVKKAWSAARDQPVQHDLASCGALPIPVRLQGQTDDQTYTCTSDFDAVLDFYGTSLRRIGYDEVARVSGRGTCQSGGKTVLLTIAGTARTDGTFTGTVAGTVEGIGQDTAPLTGSFHLGQLNLSFQGLEPIHNVAYSGTVSTR